MKLARFTKLFAGWIAATGMLLTACRAPLPTSTPLPPSPTATVRPPASATPWPSPVFPTVIPSATPAPTLTPPAPSPTAVVSPQPLAPLPTATPDITHITATDWVTGPASAPVTIIEYTDYQCASCALLTSVLLQIRQDFPNDVRVVHRHFPMIWLTQDGKPAHDKSELATEAAEAAGAQGKFWDMHTVLFANYSQWVNMSPKEFRGWLSNYAEQAGLDLPKFSAAMANHTYAPQVADALAAAYNFGVGSAPLVLFNGEPYQGPKERWAFTTLIKLEKFKGRQFTTRPPQILDPFRQYRATLHTDQGAIVIELYGDQAPITVNNFIFLARQGWYDGVTFHTVVNIKASSVITNYVQTGDPTDTGWGNPGYFIPDEINPDLKFNAAGWVGMANTGPDTNGSQFFITRAAMPQLNGKHTLFGKIISGLDVLAKLTPRDPAQNPEAPPGDIIRSVTIEEK
jgi:cyclophilin family peptidyl-prolyl cis-trans isomerase/protein-disulfide isomerase